MDKTRQERASGWRHVLPSKRRLIQLYAALLYNAHLKGFVTGTIYQGNAKSVCLPGLNCYSCPGAVGACPLGLIQNELGNLEKGIGFYALGSVLLYGLILGRTVCGWLCPFGLIQELLYKIPSYKVAKNRITRALTYVKYLLLAVLVVAVPVTLALRDNVAVVAFCKYVCPAGTLEGALGLLPTNPDFASMLFVLFTNKFVILVLVLSACIFVYRAFCRFLCPLGAIYGMFNQLSVIGVRVDAERCVGCGSCVRGCRMDVRRVGDRECIHCSECVASCPVAAISLEAAEATLIAKRAESAGASATEEPVESEQRQTRRSRTVVACMVAVLIAALVYFNVDAEPRDSDTSLGEVGAIASAEGPEEGQVLQDFSIECLDGSTFSLAASRGKVTFVNLWATYCEPCVKELPYFMDLYHEHPDEIALVAVHAPRLNPNVDTNDFVADLGLDFPVAVDTEEVDVCGIVGSDGATLPQTVVLDREGRVIYNKVGSVTPDLLEQLFDQARGREDRASLEPL